MPSRAEAHFARTGLTMPPVDGKPHGGDVAAFLKRRRKDGGWR